MEQPEETETSEELDEDSTPTDQDDTVADDSEEDQATKLDDEL